MTTTTWTIQTRTGRNTWSTVTIEATSLARAINTAERITGGRFVQVES